MGNPITATIGAYEIATESGFDYLIGPLRAHLGDVSTPFQFSDGLLRRALVDSVRALTKRWQSRYVVTCTGPYVTQSGVPFIMSGVDYSTWFAIRAVGGWSFPVAEPPTILVEDERPIILQASINIKRGILQKNALGFGSWRDDELSLSNVQGATSLRDSIKMDESELTDMLPPRGKKLAHPRKQSLVGFSTVTNLYEGDNY